MLFDLNQQAAELPEAWRSAVLGRVGAANIKVLRMDARSIADEVHDYSEGLLVISGHLRLQVAGEEVVVRAGQLYQAAAGVPHRVLPGSAGTLVIFDLPEKGRDLSRT
ncbi:cupin domain-containing protein [Serratia marcescens]|uniref:cupin domain-containing protein n=1 Tax=Serratia TaxID=613 RepID=UPI0002AF3A41|nr:cupin domain-containing protein [Serratia marcescens]AGE18322.1 cupin 2 domain-containing protein [Serratia marcescens WW4]AXX18238.1 cupin domain-containing protein [Serratia marcescens]AXX24346.1 cupin domain-containing protein [Serratia marcescens]MDF9719189.1 cupin domain-containing protein [Serratia marcescens]MDP8859250.1 cupin domain-containing protein [Serratia marcescens]